MSKDRQPKHRQEARDLRRRIARQGMYEHVLIVCEGEKSEPNYLEDIRIEQRLHSANVVVRHSELGTQPLQVVQYAEQLFLAGDSHRRIERRSFNRVFTVFDRDDHPTFHEARRYAGSLRHQNSDDEDVEFQVIASVPCFELWLLLHYEDVFEPVHRDEVHRRLRRHMAAYAKGGKGHWAQTKPHLERATDRAQHLAEHPQASNGHQPMTQMHELVQYLLKLRS
jgi:hypothetical protein